MHLPILMDISNSLLLSAFGVKTLVSCGLKGGFLMRTQHVVNLFCNQVLKIIS